MIRSSTLARSVKGLLLLSSLTVIACGGTPRATVASPASEAAMAPNDAGQTTPRTVEEAQEQIARAKTALERGGGLPGDATSAPAPQSLTGREERPEDTCGGTCRALASMKRAVEALCRMTGDADARCVDAKRTLDENTARTSSCRCDPR